MSSDVYFYWLGDRFWPRAGPVGTTASRTPPGRSGSAPGHRHPAAGRAAAGFVLDAELAKQAPRRQPDGLPRRAAGTPATTSTWPSARATCWSPRCSWPTPTPPSPTAARSTSRNVVLRGAEATAATRPSPTTCVRTIEPGRHRARSTCRPTSTTRSSPGFTGRRPPPSGTAGAAFRASTSTPSRRRQDRHRPGRRQGRHVAVRRLRPGRRPPLRDRGRARGVRLRRRRPRPRWSRHVFETRARGQAAPSAVTARRQPATCGLMAAHPLAVGAAASGPRPQPPRPVRRPWRHLDLVLLGRARWPSPCLGVLMVYSATRTASATAARPAHDRSFLLKQVALRGRSASCVMVRRRRRSTTASTATGSCPIYVGHRACCWRWWSRRSARRSKGAQAWFAARPASSSSRPSWPSWC